MKRYIIKCKSEETFELVIYGPGRSLEESIGDKQGLFRSVLDQQPVQQQCVSWERS